MMNQIEIHKKIDEIISKNSASVKQEEVSSLISFNDDTRQYFYTNVDEKWLDWLWDNGFLNIIKEKAADLNRRYRIPELDYLSRAAEKFPKEVVDIMLSIPIITETYNPEVIDRFLWICKRLPANQLSRVVEKIRDERWIPLMGESNQWFNYDEMFKVLAEAKHYGSILILAEAILAVRSKNGIAKEISGINKDNPFYFSDLSETKVFEYLSNIDDSCIEKALSLTSQILNKIICLGEPSENKVFNAGVPFPFVKCPNGVAWIS